MILNESAEMYLETILILSNKKDVVKSIDIAGKMGFSKPSVSRAIHILEKDGYVEIDKDGAIALSKTGKAIAKKIYERHLVITQTLINLGVDKKTAAEDACKIEHDLSDKTFNIIKKQLKNKGDYDKAMAADTVEKKIVPKADTKAPSKTAKTVAKPAAKTTKAAPKSTAKTSRAASKPAAKTTKANAKPAAKTTKANAKASKPAAKATKVSSKTTAKTATKKTTKKK